MIQHEDLDIKKILILALLSPVLFLCMVLFISTIIIVRVTENVLSWAIAFPVKTIETGSRPSPLQTSISSFTRTKA